jgi:hypothetical protein
MLLVDKGGVGVGASPQPLSQEEGLNKTKPKNAYKMMREKSIINYRQKGYSE